MGNQRKLILGWTGVLVGIVVCSAPADEPKFFLPQSALDSGFISLFDGTTMFGWQPTGDAKWQVVDGEIRTDGTKPGFLMTTTRWADFQLIVDFKAPTSTNSGIFIRSAEKPTSPTSDCYEINIAPLENPFPTGSIVGRKKFEAMKRTKAPSEWQTLTIAAKGNKFRVQLSGDAVLNYTDSNPLRIGYIGLQSNDGPVAFRNIRLQPLGLESLMNGTDLKGWNTDRAEKCKFEITDGKKEGDLHMSNGPGQIETVADFTNFVLHIDCKPNGDGLNSGVFFRTLREGRWSGYESQIQNGFKDGDRTKPKDFGTGAIYRRQPVRYVVPNDHQWFTKTIVADGPHMAVWVNGYQVSDWTDTRPPKENAREGRRDAGGAIALQGHDATTDFLFRNIRAVELPR